jgi:hypothetical protein
MTVNKYYIGIDNGVSGGVAIVDQDGRLMDLFLIPTKKIGDMKTIDLNSLEDDLTPYRLLGARVSVMLEQGQKQPIFGCKGNFANGYFFGLMEGWLIANKVSYTLTNPRTWQEVIFKDIRGYTKGKKNDTKSLSLEYCRRKFPEHDIKDHNISDAICIAMYARSMDLIKG